MYITYGGTRCTSPMGVPDVHQGGGYPMYIREGGTRCTIGMGGTHKLAYLGIYCNLLSVFRFISGYL